MKALDMKKRDELGNELIKILKKYVGIKKGIVQYARITAEVDNTTEVEIKLLL